MKNNRKVTFGLCARLLHLASATSTVSLSLSLQLLLQLSLLPTFAQAAEDTGQVRHLLGKMSQALRELSYRGLFTYEYGGSLDTLKIIHTVKDGVEYERLQHLNGPEREFLRSGQQVKCLPLGDQLLRGRLLSIGKKVDRLSNHYHFTISGNERIAGRKAVILRVMPKDAFRYGYTLGIDSETGLPLKSLLIGNRQQVLERYQFVELEVGEIDEKELQPAYDGHFVVNHQLADCDRAIPVVPSQWSIEWLPSGFMFTGQHKTDNDGDMLMFTDGLTVFSVFVNSMPDKVVLEGKVQRGATVAIMSRVVRQQRPYNVTVVGEVPALTAQRVAAAIKPIF